MTAASRLNICFSPFLCLENNRSILNRYGAGPYSTVNDRLAFGLSVPAVAHLPLPQT